MSAYVISEIERADPGLMPSYRALAGPSIEKFGGRYVARGGQIDAIEGGWRPKGLVILEFPSIAKAREWYASPDYAEALAISRRALARRLIFVESL
jgi:uncharacterized protein (DUF1330 family)